MFVRSALIALLAVPAALTDTGFSAPAPAPEPLPVVQVEPVDVDAMVCLAKNIYFESRNQPRAGMKAVAAVTINRVADSRFPDTICDVVYQRTTHVCQFSWVCQGLDQPRLHNRDEFKAWLTAATIAFKAVVGALNHDVDDALFFHATYVTPGWASRMNTVAQVGDHIFYSIN